MLRIILDVDAYNKKYKTDYQAVFIDYYHTTDDAHLYAVKSRTIISLGDITEQFDEYLDFIQDFQFTEPTKVRLSYKIAEDGLGFYIYVNEERARNLEIFDEFLTFLMDKVKERTGLYDWEEIDYAEFYFEKELKRIYVKTYEKGEFNVEL